MSDNIKLYSASWCNGCKVVKNLLDSLEVDYETYLLDNPENLKNAKELGIKTIPVTFIDDTRFDGSSEVTLMTIQSILDLKGYSKID